MITTVTVETVSTDEGNRIQETLKKVGIELKQRRKKGKTELVVLIDEDVFKLSISRNAGAPRKPIVHNGKQLRRIRYSTVMKMIAELGSEETAKQLGFSRRTLYRRLKDCKDNGSDYIESY